MPFLRNHASAGLFSLAAVALLSGMAAVQVWSARQEAQTWDEGIEISSGYTYLITGQYRLVPEHPPLARVLAALPLLWMKLAVPFDDPSWAQRDAAVFGRKFLYWNRVPPDAILFAARVPTILTTVALGLLLAWWTRRAFGPWAARGCLLLFVFDPNIIAIGRYIKNDMTVALMTMLAVVVWGEYLRTKRHSWLAGAGVAFGLAAATKFSALFLAPVFVITWFIARWHERRSLKPLRCVAAMAVLGAVALVTLLATYAPEWRKLIPTTRAYRAAHPGVRRLADGTRANTFTGAATHLGIQDHPLLVGLVRFFDHASTGHPAYLLGRTSSDGWWYYFPVAFAVKTPVATLIAIALAIGLALHRGFAAGRGWLRSIRLEWFLCAVPLALYWPIAMASHVDIGVRYLFPIYPFIFILTAAVLARADWRGRVPVAVALTAMMAIESVSVYPHYLAFFNFAVGGPAAGPRYLLDSNIDWGQDLLGLRDYWIARGRPRLCFEYFGTADLDYYGLPHERIARTWEAEDRQEMNCLAAVSATVLYDAYLQPGSFRWLREQPPMARIGYSIYVYDLRKPVR